MEDSIINGMLGEGEKYTDYILDGIDDSLPKIYIQNNKRFYYNQGNNAWSKKSCTLFAPIGAVSDLWDFQYSLSEIKEIDDESYKRGRLPDSGWRVQSGVELVCDFWNKKNPDKKVAFYRIDLNDKKLVMDILSKNYTIVTGYKGNSKYNLDYQSDCILNGTNFGTTTYGHCTCLIGIGGDIYVKDNYDGKKYNVYKLDHYPKEISGWNYYGYVITKVKDNNMEELKKQNLMKSLVSQVIALNSQIYDLSSDTGYQIELHKMNDKNREKLNQVNNILKSLES